MGCRAAAAAAAWRHPAVVHSSDTRRRCASHTAAPHPPPRLTRCRRRRPPPAVPPAGGRLHAARGRRQGLPLPLQDLRAAPEGARGAEGGARAPLLPAGVLRGLWGVRPPPPLPPPLLLHCRSRAPSQLACLPVDPCSPLVFLLKNRSAASSSRWRTLTATSARAARASTSTTRGGGASARWRTCSRRRAPSTRRWEGVQGAGCRGCLGPAPLVAVDCGRGRRRGFSACPPGIYSPLPTPTLSRRSC